MIFFAVVALLAIGSAVFIGVYSSNKVAQMRMSVVDDENYYKIAEENNYRQALYEACDSLKNLDANLGKVAISNNSSNQAQMLTNIVVHANNVNSNLSNLPIADSDNLLACKKFANQTQDYATYLLKKIAKGEEISASEKAALESLDDVATNLYDFLQAYAESDSGMFLTNGNGMYNIGALTDKMNEMDENSFSYEKLIYDGPFSDSVTAKTLKTKAIGGEKGKAVVENLFGNATFVQTINKNGLWYSYSLDNGRVLLASDGRVAEYETYVESGNDKSISGEDCIAIAEEFCATLGYDVKGIWISKVQDSTVYVNCATVKDNVIIYPDMVKVAVDCYSGKVVGLEAKAYLFNHQDWNVNFGTITEEQARKAVDSALTITNVAKCLIEKDSNYYTCYEFQCEMSNRQYYVYVDSNSGKEVEIFKVIQNTEGHTVM